MNIPSFNVINTIDKMTPPQSPPPSPTKKQSFNPSTSPVSTQTKIFKKTVTIKVDIEFPPEVNTDGLYDRNFNIMELSDFYDLIFAYNVIRMKCMYQNIKDKNYRWLFFSDEYETYERDESQDLVLENVFHEKWYKGKIMTVYYLDNDFKYGKYELPANKQEYEENTVIYKQLYIMMRKNNNYIGKYIKNKKV